MLPPERRLPEVRRLIEEKSYFVLHAPRQTGKTTSLAALAQTLTAEGRYAALLTSCEAGQLAGSNLETGISAVLETLLQDAKISLPRELQPPAPDSSLGAATRLRELLLRWAQECPLPVVLFLDEIDSLRDETLLSVLRQLRSGYRNRPAHFPQSVVLIGLRDVRDYRIHSDAEEDRLGTSSPFNIKVESLTLRNFNAGEVSELYAQHTADTGQDFTADAKSLAYVLTGGQPWLVNALARQAVESTDSAIPIAVPQIESAKEALVQRRDTHLDSLVDRLREPRVRRVLEPILAGELFPPDVLDDDVQFVKDLGLIVSGPAGLEIANPIYREVIPRALTSVVQDSLPIPRSPFIAPDGSLRFAKLLEDFRAFWCENAEFFLARQPYSEAAAQLVFMAYLQRIVNGGGFIDREYGVGRGRIDLCVRWPYSGGLQRWAVELKVWRDHRPDPSFEGLEQLSGYLDRLGLDRGTLILFDGRTAAGPLPARCSLRETEQQGKKITVLRL
jgi:hypothetical protein